MQEEDAASAGDPSVGDHREQAVKSLTGVDRVKQVAFFSGQSADCVIAALARHAVAFLGEAEDDVVGRDVVGVQRQVEVRRRLQEVPRRLRPQEHLFDGLSPRRRDGVHPPAESAERQSEQQPRGR